MEIRYETHNSQYLGRTMEYKVYGSSGLPCIALPAEGTRFYDWEERGMTDAVSRWIDEGKLMLICPDSLDSETFLADGPQRQRIELHERWLCYLTRELLPVVQRLCKDPDAKPLLAGCGLGAAHAVNCLLRSPDRFCGVVALSGLYDTQRFFADSTDDLVYRNSPLKVLAALPATDPRLTHCRKASPVVLCCGQGSGMEQDALTDTRALAHLLEAKNIPFWADEWGTDVTHDWFWWAKQMTYFTEQTLFKEKA